MLSPGTCFEEREPVFKQSLAGGKGRHTHRCPDNRPHLATCAQVLIWSGDSALACSYLGAQSRYSYLSDKLTFLFLKFTERQHLQTCAAGVADSEVGTEAEHVVVLF